MPKTRDRVEVWANTMVWVLEKDASGQPVSARLVPHGHLAPGTDCYAHRDSMEAAARKAQDEFWRISKPAALASQE